MLTANLITKVNDWDIEESIENLINKQAHLNKFIESRRSYEVSVDVWKKKPQMAKKVLFMTGQVSWEMIRKHCCFTFQRK